MWCIWVRQGAVTREEKCEVKMSDNLIEGETESREAKVDLMWE